MNQKFVFPHTFVNVRTYTFNAVGGGGAIVRHYRKLLHKFTRIFVFFFF